MNSYKLKKMKSNFVQQVVREQMYVAFGWCWVSPWWHNIKWAV